MAPKPVIILAKEKDYFDVRGAEETYARLKHLYALLGAEENIKLHIGPTGHGYTIENREAMYQWFNRATGISDAKTEPKLVIEKDEDALVYAEGAGERVEVADRVLVHARKRRKLLATKRVELEAGGARPIGWRVCCNCPGAAGVPEFRILRPRGNRKYPEAARDHLRGRDREGHFGNCLPALGPGPLLAANQGRQAGRSSTSRTTPRTPSCATSRCWPNW